MPLGLKEFVRRFCLHLLPERFVKIRQLYGPTRIFLEDSFHLEEEANCNRTNRTRRWNSQ